MTNVSIMQHMTGDSMICVNDLHDVGMSVERQNKDTGTNEYGSRLLNVCQGADLIMMNGRAGKDKGVGRKTLFNKRGESTIDYVICNKTVVNKINDFEIHSPNVFSDHVIVSYALSIPDGEQAV